MNLITILVELAQWLNILNMCLFVDSCCVRPNCGLTQPIIWLIVEARARPYAHFHWGSYSLRVVHHKHCSKFMYFMYFPQISCRFIQMKCFFTKSIITSSPGQLQACRFLCQVEEQLLLKMQPRM